MSLVFRWSYDVLISSITDHVHPPLVMFSLKATSHLYVHMDLCMYAFMYMCMYLCVFVCMHVFLQFWG
jgi:hypothetical protein